MATEPQWPPLTESQSTRGGSAPLSRTKPPSKTPTADGWHDARTPVPLHPMLTCERRPRMHLARTTPFLSQLPQCETS